MNFWNILGWNQHRMHGASNWSRSVWQVPDYHQKNDGDKHFGILISTYRICVTFGERHRVHFDKGFNVIDRFLVWPLTPLCGGFSPVKYINFIDIRTNMTVGETLQMIQVYFLLNRKHTWQIELKHGTSHVIIIFNTFYNLNSFHVCVFIFRHSTVQ